MMNDVGLSHTCRARVVAVHIWLTIQPGLDNLSGSHLAVSSRPVSLTFRDSLLMV